MGTAGETSPHLWTCTKGKAGLAERTAGLQREAHPTARDRLHPTSSRAISNPRFGRAARHSHFIHSAGRRY
jgi:hypothetical protein